MKKLSALLPILLFQFISLAQSIPSGDFEDWVERDNFKLDSFTSFGEVSRSNDAHEGNYALRLDNIDNPNGDRSGFIANASIGMNIEGGQAYDEAPLSMRFYAKYDLAVGDIGQIVSLFLLNGNIIGSARIDLEGSTNDTFLKFSVPIQWAISAIPDTMVVIMASRDLDEDTVAGDGYLIVDDFHFATITHRDKDLANGDFESWSSEGNMAPRNWFTTDDFLAGLGVQPPHALASRSTDAHAGMYSLHLRNAQVGTEVFPGVAGSVQSFEGLEKPGFPVNRNWKYLEGWYKYQSSGADSLTMTVGMFKLGVPLALGIHKSNKSVSDWTYFSVPLTYFTNLVVADSATVVLTSSNPEKANDGNTQLWVDDLKFTDSPLNVYDRSANKLKFYPNPFTDQIVLEGVNKIDGARYQLIGIDGKIVEEGEISNQKVIQVDKSLPNGVYLLNLNSDRIKLSKMLIKK